MRDNVLNYKFLDFYWIFSREISSILIMCKKMISSFGHFYSSRHQKSCQNLKLKKIELFTFRIWKNWFKTKKFEFQTTRYSKNYTNEVNLFLFSDFEWLSIIINFFSFQLISRKFRDPLNVKNKFGKEDEFEKLGEGLKRLWLPTIFVCIENIFLFPLGKKLKAKWKEKDNFQHEKR